LTIPFGTTAVAPRDFDSHGRQILLDPAYGS
jgi:hypothetical protein